ncbi:UPF0481 protein At3g47200-like [Chenopodium quinoa]|uniref:Uncharacterized protein n=1 Tax=Chenopodium quinoa TaxID=63459 RepID=A0A803MAM9_CHEQI|nr:UPF0481 protein At3g47200-like [Chenopodium quinoa]
MSSQEKLEWVISIQEKLNEAQQFITRKSWEKCCIYRMPRRIRDAQESKKIYEPQTISIGPYHIGSELVQDMDLYKWVALYQILRRTGQNLSLYFDTVSQVEDQARACYQQVNHLSSNKFVEMMVLDGCFILELLRYYPARGTTGGNPVFANKRIVEGIVLDMVMLENQVPLFIIDRLLKLMNGNQHQNDQALDLVLNFFNPKWLTGIRMSVNELNELNRSLKQEECLHVLDVFRRSLLHVRPQQGTINKHRFRWIPMCLKRWLHCLCENKASDSISGREQVLHSVTELRKGGVKFRKRNTSCFLDFRFKNGVLEIPPICIHDNTKTILLNITAFEHCHMKISDGVIASYVVFMERLLKSPEDVGHLHRHGIILGDGAQAVDMFKSVCKEMLVNVHDGYYADLSKEVNAYYSQRRNRWRASLLQKYFHNPWSAISLVAAIFLLCLTALQSFYAVFSYHRPNSS